MKNDTTGISSKQVAKLKTVFSHIVQTTHLSQESENVATTALCFILNERPEARTGFLKLLGGVLSTELPNLNFKTQQSEENTTQSDSAEPSVENPKKRRGKEQSRPDMVGYDENENVPIVYIENKFWAGLTANQPVSYLKILATQSRPTMLLVVVPDRRSEEVWGEMMRRLPKDKIQEEVAPKGIIHCAKVSLNPHGQKLALTSWGNLIDSLEKTPSDRATQNDIEQLKSLCNQEENAYHPISSEEMTNLRTPYLVRQLTAIVDKATDSAFHENVFHEAGKRRISGSSQDDYGKFVSILSDRRCGLWFGLNFKWWSEYGYSPLWAAFQTKFNNWGRPQEVSKILKPWADEKEIFTTTDRDGNFIVAIDIPHDKEKEDVILAIVKLFAEIGHKLSGLPPRKNDAQPVAVEPNLSQG